MTNCDKRNNVIFLLGKAKGEVNKKNTFYGEHFHIPQIKKLHNVVIWKTKIITLKKNLQFAERTMPTFHFQDKKHLFS